MPQKDADPEYLGRDKIAFNSYIGNINFVDPVNIRKAHDKLMKQVRNEAIHISNKYKVH